MSEPFAFPNAVSTQSSPVSLNALLATLNAREKLRDRTYGVTSVPVEFGTITRTTGQTGSGGTSEPIYEGSMPSVSRIVGFFGHAHDHDLENENRCGASC